MNLGQKIKKSENDEQKIGEEIDRLGKLAQILTYLKFF